jgi:alpha-galactosidase
MLIWSAAVGSGNFWMNHEVDIELRGDFQAAAFTLVEVGH